ncbi:MAG: UDP-GlcNAc--UDP-phosphate GlcNAc-1-phosphate transferase [Cyclobacteriaceae bacterium]|nr:UDP-GlcNAc--UDP-phosphate GlcNAc-1-phosphate transferase [Cyclobacteriaceae bacterium]
MNYLILGLCGLAMFSASRIYFKLANRFNIIDRPNHRSAHTRHTIRGGGIVFVIAVGLHALFFDTLPAITLAGFFIIAFVSFIDDVKDLPNRIRIIAHFTAMSLLLISLETSAFPIWANVIIIIIAVGAMNAYNFMDGINGITGVYSLTGIITILYLNNYYLPLAQNEFFVLLIIALLIFNYFNFRKNAVCFAGDVGSISLAFILIAFILQLTYATGNLVFVLLLAVYGVDSVLTILHRLRLGENIFKAHRFHLFQVLVIQGKAGHLKVSAIYAIVQLLINSLLILVLQKSVVFQAIFAFFILFLLSLSYVYLKSRYLQTQYQLK